MPATAYVALRWQQSNRRTGHTTRLEPLEPQPMFREVPVIRIAKFIIFTYLLAGIWLGYAFFQERDVAEKVLTSLVMPCGLLWLLSGLLFIVTAFQGQRLAARLALLLWCLMTVGGNGFVGVMLMRHLEKPYLNVDPFTSGPLDTVVVLGGYSRVGANGLTCLGWGGDRVMLAIRMYHRNLVGQIICTGNQIPALDRDGKQPYEMGIELLQDAGIPPEHIRHTEGSNTSKEMANLAKSLGPDTSLGLITSAFHMGRAMRLAKKYGLEMKPLPADVRTRAIWKPTPVDFVPSASALYLTRVACKEHLAQRIGR